MSRNVTPAVRSNPTSEGVHSTTGEAPTPQLSIVETELRQIATEATLKGFVNAGLVEDKTRARTLLVALRVENVDEVLARVFPDEKGIAVKAELEEALQQLVSRAYQAGSADALARLAEDQTKPVSRVVKTVHEDEHGHVRTITEESYRLNPKEAT